MLGRDGARPSWKVPLFVSADGLHRRKEMVCGIESLARKTNLPGALLVCLAVLAAACGGEPEGVFSPLIQPGPAGGYDLMVEGVADIRAAELAPGAAPAVARIEGESATKTGHFIATYAGEADPAVIGQQMVDALKGASFILAVESSASDGGESWSATVTYETAGAKGTAEFRLSRTESPTRLDVTFAVHERRR